MISLIFIVLIAATIVAFSIQNMSDVTISFFVWQFDISVSMVIFFSVFAGIIVAQLLRRMTANRREKTRSTIEFINRRSQ